MDSSQTVCQRFQDGLLTVWWPSWGHIAWVPMWDGPHARKDWPSQTRGFIPGLDGQPFPVVYVSITNVYWNSEPGVPELEPECTRTQFQVYRDLIPIPPRLSKSIPIHFSVTVITWKLRGFSAEGYPEPGRGPCMLGSGDRKPFGSGPDDESYRIPKWSHAKAFTWIHTHTTSRREKQRSMRSGRRKDGRRAVMRSNHLHETDHTILYSHCSGFSLSLSSPWWLDKIVMV